MAETEQCCSSAIGEEKGQSRNLRNEEEENEEKEKERGVEVERILIFVGLIKIEKNLKV